MNQLYGLLQPDEGEILVDGEAKGLPQPPGTRSRPGHRHGSISTSCWYRSSPWRKKHRARRRGTCAAARLGILDRRRNRREVLETSQKIRPAGRPGRAGWRICRSAAQAAGRDRQGAEPATSTCSFLDEPTRRWLTPQEDRRAARGHAQPWPRPAKSIVFITQQAARGQGGRRPDHGDPPAAARFGTATPDTAEGGNWPPSMGRPGRQPRGQQEPRPSPAARC